MTIDECIEWCENCIKVCSAEHVASPYIHICKYLHELKTRKEKDEASIKMKVAAIQAGLC